MGVTRWMGVTVTGDVHDDDQYLEWRKVYEVNLLLMMRGEV